MELLYTSKFNETIRKLVPPNWVFKEISNEPTSYQIQFWLKSPKTIRANDVTTQGNRAYEINMKNWWQKSNRYTLKLKGISFTLQDYDTRLNLKPYLFVHALIESRAYRHKYFSTSDYNTRIVKQEFDSIKKMQIDVEEIQKYVSDFVKLTQMK